MLRTMAYMLLSLFVACLSVAAQGNPIPGPANAPGHFEVASIHPSRPGTSARDARVAMGVDRFDAEAATVGDILDMLNDWQLERVVGGPDWMRTDRYDIHAKAVASMPLKERKAAVMALLADRFKLVAHDETRAISVTVLTAPKRPAGLKPAADGEAPAIRYGAHGDPVFVAMPMSAVTNYLSQMWHSPVVDQTGLAGSYDFSLAPSAVGPAPGQMWGDLVREAVFAFGFKVEMRKVPTEITAVDHLERPSEN